MNRWSGRGHDVERKARVEQPHRARQGDVGAAHHQHLALDAAQVRQAVAGGEAAAVEHGTGGLRRRDIEPDRHAELVQPQGQGRQRRARVEMGLLGEEQPLREATGEVRLEPGDRGRVQAAVVAGAPGEALEVGLVAPLRQDEAAAAHGARMLLRPIGQGLAPELDHELLGTLPLAPGCEHPAGIARAGRGTERRAALDHLDRAATPGQGQCAGQAGHAGADDGDVHASPGGHGRRGRRGLGYLARSAHPFASVTWIRFEGSPCRAHAPMASQPPVGTPLGEPDVGAQVRGGQTGSRADVGPGASSCKSLRRRAAGKGRIVPGCHHEGARSADDRSTIVLVEVGLFVDDGETIDRYTGRDGKIALGTRIVALGTLVRHPRRRSSPVPDSRSSPVPLSTSQGVARSRLAAFGKHDRERPRRCRARDRYTSRRLSRRRQSTTVRTCPSPAKATTATASPAAISAMAATTVGSRNARTRPVRASSCSAASTLPETSTARTSSMSTGSLSDDVHRQQDEAGQHGGQPERHGRGPPSRFSRACAGSARPPAWRPPAGIAPAARDWARPRRSRCP